MFLFGNSSRTNSKLSYRFESHLFFRFAIDTMISFFFLCLFFYICVIYKYPVMFKHPATSRLIHKSQYFISSYFFFVLLYFISLVFSVCLLLDFVSHQIFYSVCSKPYTFMLIYLFWAFILCLFDFSYVSLITNHSINLSGYFFSFSLTKNITKFHLFNVSIH